MPTIGSTLDIIPNLEDWVDPNLAPLNVVVNIQYGGAGPWSNITTMANGATYGWIVAGPVGTAQLRYSNPLNVVYTVYGAVFNISAAGAGSPFRPGEARGPYTGNP
jgi:hypothetical protein